MFVISENNHSCSSNLYDVASEILSSLESFLRYCIIDPLFPACNKYLQDHNNDVAFYCGEVELKSVTVQLNVLNTTQLAQFCLTEYPLSEVFSAFAENDKVKTSSDHYKAMFGLLMILKTNAKRYKYASFNTLKKLKIHFIHTQ